MGMIVQVCIVIVTIAILAMAFVAIGVMLQLKATTKKLEASYLYLQEILEDSRETSKKVRELVSVLEQVATTVQKGSARVETVVDRAATVSEFVLDEIQYPVFRAVTIIRALRSGARAIARRWTHGRQVGFQPLQGDHHV